MKSMTSCSTHGDIREELPVCPKCYDELQKHNIQKAMPQGYKISRDGKGLIACVKNMEPAKEAPDYIEYHIHAEELTLLERWILQRLTQIEDMKNCSNCDNQYKDHSKVPLCHCSRIAHWKTAEEHLHKDMWQMKEAR